LTHRLYYRDAALIEFTATVTDVTAVGEHVVVSLDRTAFYPTSGGQPHDLGDIDGSTVVEVLDSPRGVEHVVRGPAPRVGQVVKGKIDQVRRTDHTQQHSGQHVLSQAFERILAAQTVSFHLGSDACTIDVDRSDLDRSTCLAAENMANQIVLDDRLVSIHFASGEGLSQFALRKPSDRAGEIRIVDIENFDQTPCGGTHVARTGQIGPIKIRRWERRGPTTRIEFLCGWRSLRDYSARHLAIRDIAERLSAADHDVRELVFRSLDELTRAKDDLTRLRDVLLDAEADRLIASADVIPSGDGTIAVRRSFADRSPDELKRLALLIVSRQKSVVLLGSSGERNHLVVAQSPGCRSDAASILRQVAPTIGARGGGTRDFAQGGGPAGISVDVALEAATHLL
jgi:alanyl-tRNA synthetase